MENETVAPDSIEARSFEIIRSELGLALDPLTEHVVLRVIHATADFEFAGLLDFSPGALDAARAAFGRGESVVTDTAMAAAGVSKPALGALGCALHCFMGDADVAAEALRRGVTRASVSMERAASLPGRPVIAIGNAPTALMRLCGLMEEGRISPSLVIGSPVGFVNVVQSKEMLASSGAERIIVSGRKGGSTVAAAIMNALLYDAGGRTLGG